MGALTETAHHSPKASPDAHHINCRGREIRHIPCGSIGRPSVFVVMTHRSDAKCNQVVNRSSRALNGSSYVQRSLAEAPHCVTWAKDLLIIA